MRRRLIVLRHAKSAYPDGVADHDRPLNDRGRRDAPAAGRWIADNVGALDLTVCSTATRAQQTADLAGVSTKDTRDEPRVYDASTGDLLDVVQSLPSTAATVLVIGHSPGLSMLVSALSGVQTELKTSGIAVLEFDGDWSEIDAAQVALTATATPRG